MSGGFGFFLRGCGKFVRRKEGLEDFGFKEVVPCFSLEVISPNP